MVFSKQLNKLHLQNFDIVVFSLVEKLACLSLFTLRLGYELQNAEVTSVLRLSFHQNPIVSEYCVHCLSLLHTFNFSLLQSSCFTSIPHVHLTPLS